MSTSPWLQPLPQLGHLAEFLRKAWPTSKPWQSCAQKVQSSTQTCNGDHPEAEITELGERGSDKVVTSVF